MYIPTTYVGMFNKWGETMSRYIEVDALKKDIARLHALNDEIEIRRAYLLNPHSTSTDFEETLVSVFDAIDDAPSIDIVPCKECKHTQDRHWTTEGMKFCGKLTGWVYDNDFCSWGERKDNETD